MLNGYIALKVPQKYNKPIINDAKEIPLPNAGKTCDSSLMGACSSQPCHNGGACHDVGTNSFNCTCPQGFTGHY
jgi:hypothetical protein